jgi:hypothetical protein
MHGADDVLAALPKPASTEDTTFMLTELPFSGDRHDAEIRSPEDRDHFGRRSDDNRVRTKRTLGERRAR